MGLGSLGYVEKLPYKVPEAFGKPSTQPPIHTPMETYNKTILANPTKMINVDGHMTLLLPILL